MDPTLTFTSPVRSCEYLRGELSRLRYEITGGLTRDEYAKRLDTGWRRFGPVLFRPECPSCRACRSLRVPVAAFRASESQRRAWKLNARDVTVRVARPSSSPDKLALFARFHHYGRQVKGWPEEYGDPDLFVADPDSEEWCYYVGERLVAVGYVDVLSQGLSAIYFYWDPAERRRSLGTYNILMLIDAARRGGRPHVYLGYYVQGCRSLEYKARFRPNEIIGASGEWEAFHTGDTAGARGGTVTT